MVYNGKLNKYAHSMRRAMTKEERKLWFEFLQNLPIRVRRQKIIGSYIADFYCAKCNIVIELDGSQHFEAEGIAYDKKRNEYFESLGITVLHYANNDVNQNFEGICTDILIKLGLYNN